MPRGNPKPTEKTNWIPDDTSNIIAPSAGRKLVGWLFNIKPPAEIFNWAWNLKSRFEDYFGGQVEDWIVIDSDADEGDYATLAAYLADAPAAGNRILVKEDQTVTAQVVLPANVTLKFLDGSRLLCATNIATSVLKLGSNPIIEGVLNIVLSHTGTTGKAVEIDGDNSVGKINVENSSTGTLTTGYHVNANKIGNKIDGFIDNSGGGAITNIVVDNSTKWTNNLTIRDSINDIIQDSGVRQSDLTITESLRDLQLENWSEQSNPKNFGINGLDNNSGLLVAVGGADGVDAYIVISSNGIAWTEQTNPKNFDLQGIDNDGSQFVAVGNADGTDAYIVTSPDGIVWTEQTNPKNFTLVNVIWDGAQFVAVGDADGTDAYIITSPDGITWTERANPKNFTLVDIHYNGSLYVAVGVADGTDAYIVTSTDAVIWNEQSNPKNFSLSGIDWDGSQFVAVGNADGTDAYIITSPDGITWTEQSNPQNEGLRAVVWNGSVFVAVGSSSYIISSPDGVVWSERTVPGTTGLNDIIWDGLKYITGGSADGTDAYLLTSLNMRDI